MLSICPPNQETPKNRTFNIGKIGCTTPTTPQQTDKDNATSILPMIRTPNQKRQEHVQQYRQRQLHLWPTIHDKSCQQLSDPLNKSSLGKLKSIRAWNTRQSDAIRKNSTIRLPYGLSAETSCCSAFIVFTCSHSSLRTCGAVTKTHEKRRAWGELKGGGGEMIATLLAFGCISFTVGRAPLSRRGTAPAPDGGQGVLGTAGCSRHATHHPTRFHVCLDRSKYISGVLLPKTNTWGRQPPPLRRLLVVNYRAYYDTLLLIGRPNSPQRTCRRGWRSPASPGPSPRTSARRGRRAGR